MEHLIALDKEWFCRLGIAHTEFLDSFMMRFTSTEVWLPFFALMIYVIWKSGEWRVESGESNAQHSISKIQPLTSKIRQFFTLHSSFFITLLALILVVVLADQISYSFFKHTFERLRPSHNPMMEACVQLVDGYRGGRYGFVSSHAANTMGVALFSSLLFRYTPYTISVFLWATMTCYTRLYLGVHYPLDLIGGAMVGFFAAGVVYWIWKKRTKNILPLRFARKDLQSLSGAIVLITGVIALSCVL
jgi:undecaprenyl-diphosphatase